MSLKLECNWPTSYLETSERGRQFPFLSFSPQVSVPRPTTPELTRTIGGDNSERCFVCTCEICGALQGRADGFASCNAFLALQSYASVR